ncbi:hypothetical protein CLAFUW4_00262 [Fulvia fulva]|uniref:Uncharacterized protein n=1 Tax=Passalora fulva TaxID=5499 RepID=A0A9Q8L8C6_PASFU|nr:uncharacterized protein CLAFUR5_00262 [Fulvia fulva]KAK4634265.1 hypothetical protein CLAFUR4_00262 [Fulvia fulva]KAK4637202.1 hypothetical protein CLAFUR0_00263 [Fulvia fulva]UJO12694.1 hypothetical protein CLAFUR5_00262 [Fulvia fulva]WPV08316.1 hypothetical protein CLAFUW4_00262 [Fulvia fulva]WPV25066.1 hypothetical protein CLAFUW7_00266 [Fulvia fulva]
MTSLLKKLSIRKSPKDNKQHGTPEITDQYDDDDDERYEQQYQKSVEAQKASGGGESQRPSLLNVGGPGNAGRHPSKHGLGDIPVPEPRLERNLALDERVSGERKR